MSTSSERETGRGTEKVPAPWGAEGSGREGRGPRPAHRAAGRHRPAAPAPILHGSARLAAGQEWALCQDEQFPSCIASAHLPAAGVERTGNS